MKWFNKIFGGWTKYVRHQWFKWTNYDNMVLPEQKMVRVINFNVKAKSRLCVGVFNIVCQKFCRVYNENLTMGLLVKFHSQSSFTHYLYSSTFKKRLWVLVVATTLHQWITQPPFIIQNNTKWLVCESIIGPLKSSTYLVNS